MSWDSEGEELDCSRHRRSRFKGRAVRDSESRGEAVWTYVHVWCACVLFVSGQGCGHKFARGMGWDGMRRTDRGCVCVSDSGGSGAIRRHGRRAVDGQATGGA